MFRWNFTATRGYVYDEEISQACPLCDSGTETNHHVTGCGCGSAIMCREKSTIALQRGLDSIGIHPSIKMTSLHILSDPEISAFTPPTVTGKFGENILHNIIRDQSLIGWHQFEFEWWATSWNTFYSAFQDHRGRTV